MRTIEIDIGTVTHLAFSPDGTLLSAGGHQGIGQGPWPALIEGRGPFAITPTRDRVAQVAWHPKGYYFASAGLDGVVQMWNPRMRFLGELVELPGKDGPTTALTFSPEGDLLALGGGWWPEPAADPEPAYVVVVKVSAWAPSRWVPARALDSGCNQVGAIVFTRPGVLVAGAGNRSVVAQILTERESTTRMVTSPVQALATRPDGQRLAVAAGNQVYLWRLGPTGVPVAGGELACRGHKGVVRAIAYSSDGRRLVSVGEDGSLRFWDGETGAAKASFDLRLGHLRAVAFAPDGLTVVAAGDAGTLAIIDVE